MTVESRSRGPPLCHEACFCDKKIRDKLNDQISVSTVGAEKSFSSVFEIGSAGHHVLCLCFARCHRAATDSDEVISHLRVEVREL